VKVFLAINSKNVFLLVFAHYLLYRWQTGTKITIKWLDTTNIFMTTKTSGIFSSVCLSLSLSLSLYIYIYIYDMPKVLQERQTTTSLDVLHYSHCGFPFLHSGWSWHLIWSAFCDQFYCIFNSVFCWILIIWTQWYVMVHLHLKLQSFGNKQKVISTKFKFSFPRHLHLWGHSKLIFSAT
jgi:hypothetical protein